MELRSIEAIIKALNRAGARYLVVVPLETLIQMKRDASRPQDLSDIEELLRLQ